MPFKFAMFFLILGMSFPAFAQVVSPVSAPPSKPISQPVTVPNPTPRWDGCGRILQKLHHSRIKGPIVPEIKTPRQPSKTLDNLLRTFVKDHRPLQNNKTWQSIKPRVAEPEARLNVLAENERIKKTFSGKEISTRDLKNTEEMLSLLERLRCRYIPVEQVSELLNRYGQKVREIFAEKYRARGQTLPHQPWQDLIEVWIMLQDGDYQIWRRPIVRVEYRLRPGIPKPLELTEINLLETYYVNLESADIDTDYQSLVNRTPVRYMNLDYKKMWQPPLGGF